MTDYKPLYLSLGIIFILGVILSISISSIIDIESQTSPIVDSLTDFINDGIDLGDLDLTFFGWSFDLPSIDIFFFLPTFVKDFMINQIIIFSYLPTFILIPLVVFTITGLAWGIIALFLP